MFPLEVFSLRLSLPELEALESAELWVTEEEEEEEGVEAAEPEAAEEEEGKNEDEKPVKKCI